MAKTDYYEILGLDRKATPEEIKRAYRRKAKELHPDKNPGNKSRAEEEFKRVAEAYEVLSDQEKRLQYDRYGHAGPAQGFTFGDTDFRRARQAYSEFGFGGFDDLFDLFFRQGGRTASRRPASRQGEDIEYKLRISLEDAATGTKIKVTAPRLVRCDRCKGSGAEPDTAKTTCPTCHGRGQVEYRQQSLLGSFVNIQTCPECQGKGDVTANPCHRCHGSGRAKEKSKISVTVPAGVPENSRLRLKGQGNAGIDGAPSGDLYIVIEIIPHHQFKRDGRNILSVLKLHYPQAVLGARVPVETLWGEATITVPPGTSSGALIRIKGKGIPDLQSSGRGDHVVRVEVVIPTHITPAQKRLLKELSDLLPPLDTSGDDS